MDLGKPQMRLHLRRSEETSFEPPLELQREDAADGPAPEPVEADATEAVDS